MVSLTTNIDTLEDLVKKNFLEGAEYGFDFINQNTCKHDSVCGLREFIDDNFSLGETGFSDWILREVGKVESNGMILFHYINSDWNSNEYFSFWYRISESIVGQKNSESCEFPLTFYYDPNLIRVQTNYFVVNIYHGISQAELKRIVLAIMISQFEISKKNWML